MHIPKQFIQFVYLIFDRFYKSFRNLYLIFNFSLAQFENESLLNDYS